MDITRTLLGPNNSIASVPYTCDMCMGRFIYLQTERKKQEDHILMEIESIFRTKWMEKLCEIWNQSGVKKTTTKVSVRILYSFRTWVSII